MQLEEQLCQILYAMLGFEPYFYIGNGKSQSSAPSVVMTYVLSLPRMAFIPSETRPTHGILLYARL